MINENTQFYFEAKKKFPTRMKSEFIEALNYFPELKDTYIFIREAAFSGVQHTVRAYPPLVTFFCKKSDWVYPIDINKNTKINIPFDALSKEQKIGLFLHEFSHISTYITFSRLKMFIFSFLYFFNKKFVRKIEHETDIKVLEKGAGFYLLTFRIQQLLVRIQKPYSETQDTYLTPKDIIFHMKKMPSLYKEDEIQKYEKKLNDIGFDTQNIRSVPKISFYRKISHSFKTAYTFFPVILQMFYIINIKKVHKK